MADDQIQDPTAGEQQQPRAVNFNLQKIYTKDVSFELPNAPQIFQETGQAEVKLNLSQRVNNVAEGVYEVVLAVTVTAIVSEDKTAYLAEVHQAGLFNISGLSDPDLQGTLNTICPNILFPYASRSITDLVATGGFPPLVLQPVNFEQIYAQRLQQAAAQAESAGDMEVQGNA
jgi:preprotein translocase subunit SecB